MDCTIRVAKTKTLISFAVTAKLICVFVFAYAKSRFSHNEAQLQMTRRTTTEVPPLKTRKIVPENRHSDTHKTTKEVFDSCRLMTI